MTPRPPRPLPGRAALALVAVLVLSAAFGVGPRRGEAGTLAASELCALLSADEVSAVVGSPRTSKAEESRCSYENASAPAIHLLVSRSATRDEYLETAKELKAEVKDGPQGSVYYSLGFDLKKGKISGAWFELKGTPVELEFDGGLEAEKVGALVAAAKK